MDLIHLIIELLSPGAILFFGGRWVGRVETAAKQLSKSVETIEQIPVIAVRLQTLENALTSHIKSDHRELARDLRDTRDVAMRAEMASHHGE